MPPNIHIFLILNIEYAFLISRGKYFPPISPQKKKFLAPIANMPGQGRRPCPGILAGGKEFFFWGDMGGKYLPRLIIKVIFHVENLKNTNIGYHKGFL